MLRGARLPAMTIGVCRSGPVSWVSIEMRGPSVLGIVASDPDRLRQQSWLGPEGRTVREIVRMGTIGKVFPNWGDSMNTVVDAARHPAQGAGDTPRSARELSGASRHSCIGAPRIRVPSGSRVPRRHATAAVCWPTAGQGRCLPGRIYYTDLSRTAYGLDGPLSTRGSTRKTSSARAAGSDILREHTWPPVAINSTLYSGWGCARRSLNRHLARTRTSCVRCTGRPLVDSVEAEPRRVTRSPRLHRSEHSVSKFLPRCVSLNARAGVGRGAVARLMGLDDGTTSIGRPSRAAHAGFTRRA